MATILMYCHSPSEMAVELDKCAQIDEHTSLIPIMQQSYFATERKAIPWQYTSSVIIINSKKAGKVSANTSMYQTSSETAQLINSLANNDTSVLGSIYALIPLAISDTVIDTAPIDTTPYSAWCSFVSKENNLIYGSIWQKYSMDRLI